MPKKSSAGRRGAERNATQARGAAQARGRIRNISDLSMADNLLHIVPCRLTRWMGGASAQWDHRPTPQPLGRRPRRAPFGLAVRRSAVVPSVPAPCPGCSNCLLVLWVEYSSCVLMISAFAVSGHEVQGLKICKRFVTFLIRDRHIFMKIFSSAEDFIFNKISRNIHKGQLAG